LRYLYVNILKKTFINYKHDFMNIIKKEDPVAVRKNALILFFHRLVNKFIALFQPEEVEVTFKVEGKKISYTYTKVEHKQVA